MPALCLSSKLFQFKDEPTAAVICQTSGVAHYPYTLFTKAPWGYHQVIPYRMPILLDTAQGGAALLAAAALFIKNIRAKQVLLAISAVGLKVCALSWIDIKPDN